MGEPAVHRASNGAGGKLQRWFIVERLTKIRQERSHPAVARCEIGGRMRTRMAAPVRKDKEGSRSRILEGAAEEFATSGFSGARIDRISRRTKLNVRMIYYYFGSKKGLYRAVLENIYEEAAKILELTRQAQEPAIAALAM